MKNNKLAIACLFIKIFVWVVQYLENKEHISEHENMTLSLKVLSFWNLSNP